MREAPINALFGRAGSSRLRSCHYAYLTLFVFLSALHSISKTPLLVELVSDINESLSVSVSASFSLLHFKRPFFFPFSRPWFLLFVGTTFLCNRSFPVWLSLSLKFLNATGA